MPFEKKKHKTAKDYKQKILYLNESDPYQNECAKLLEICGHKQSKFIALLVHDYVKRMHINVDTLNEKNFKQLMALLEAQLSGGMISAFPQMGMMMQPVMVQQNSSQMPSNVTPITQAAKSEEVRNDDQDDEFINKDDMAEMNEALSAWNVG